MTTVDDNLLGTGAVRSGKAGAKGGKQNAMDVASQRSAFENAFANAGKKQQPMISIGAKPVTETAEQIQAAALKSMSIKGENDVAAARPSVEAEVALTTADTGFEVKVPVPGDTIKPDAETGADGTGRNTKTALPKHDKDVLASISLSGLNAEVSADAGKAIEGAVGDKIKDLLGKSQPSRTIPLDSDPASSETGEATDMPGDADVSQLLSLLDAAKTPSAATTATPVAAAPVMSEFQALADRAGKGKAANTDGVAAGKAEARAERDANAVKNATQAGSDQVFRFARADGKGQAVSMNISSEGDKTVVKNDGAASNAKAETVTVLEARRYLGLAPSGNAAAVTSQIANNPEWVRSLQASEAAAGLSSPAQGGADKVLNTLKIQMHPIDLGTVTATLRLKDDELQVELKVETGDAFRQLSDDQNAMVKALRAQGFAVDQVSVVFNAPDSSGGNAQGQAQPQAGQQGREMAGNSQAQGNRGQSNGGDSQRQGGERFAGNDGTNDAASGSELNRTGGVYM